MHSLNKSERANYPKYYKEAEKKLVKEQRKLSRMEIGSINWYKQKKKLSVIQGRISNQRKDWLHKKSYELSVNYDAICFEDIDLRNLAQCMELGKKLHDNGYGMFRRFVQYKLEDRGKHFVKTDKWFPSSKTCNECGYKYEGLELHMKDWKCKSCGSTHNRDENAARNIRDEGIKQLKSAM